MLNLNIEYLQIGQGELRWQEFIFGEGEPPATPIDGTLQVIGIIRGDFDRDGLVDYPDLFLFADAFGGTDLLYDLDENGTVDADDYTILTENFGQTATR